MISPERAAQLRRALGEGKTLDQAFAELRAAGVGPCACIVALRTVRGGTLMEAKRTVMNSPAWWDVQSQLEAELASLSDP